MADTANPGESAVRRGRSPSFPFIPLETVVTRLRELMDKFGRHPVPVQKVGLAWKMKGSSSQAFQTMAALKSFGFLKYEGSGNDRKAVLTDDAWTYLRAQQEQIKKDIVRKAALKPKEIAKYWAEWRADPPIDEVRLDGLVLNENYTEDGAKSFLRVYDATIDYAGLSSSDKCPAMDGGDYNDGSQSAKLDTKREPSQRLVRPDRGHATSPPHGTPFRVALEGDVIEVTGRLTTPEEVDKLVKILRLNKVMITPLHGASATEYTDDEEGREAEERDRKLSEEIDGDE